MPEGAFTTAESVYPHWRGEHTNKRRFINPPSGLSPLARGTLARRSGKYDRRRFIPAGAGNTSERANTAIFPSVYPR
ncbi:hypothetical protein L912_2742 [Escherichia coli SCD1]|nr:hypothetical protein L912_2742 [Escherichia coli SCD1]